MRKDTLLHIVLIGGVTIGLHLLVEVLGLAWGLLMAAILIHLLREATQHEVKHFNGRFGPGWWPFHSEHPYSGDKLREAYVPVVAWAGLCLAISLLT